MTDLTIAGIEEVPSTAGTTWTGQVQVRLSDGRILSGVRALNVVRDDDGEVTLVLTVPFSGPHPAEAKTLPEGFERPWILSGVSTDEQDRREAAAKWLDEAAEWLHENGVDLSEMEPVDFSTTFVAAAPTKEGKSDG